MTTKYRKKPVEVEAIQFDGTNWNEVREWCQQLEPEGNPERKDRIWFFPVDDGDGYGDPEVTAEVFDKLHSIWVGVKTGDWILHGVRGEFYPCDDEAFQQTYEPVP